MATAPADARAADLAARYWSYRCREFPAAAVAAGLDVAEDALFREAPADHDRRRAESAAFLTELDALAGGRVDARDAVTLGLLRHELATAIALHDAGAHETPALFPYGPAFWCVNVANTTTLANAQDAERWADRLATFPSFVRDVEASLSAGYRRGARYPRTVLAAAAANVRAAVAGPADATAWYGPYRRAAHVSGADRAALRARTAIAEQIVPAFLAHAAFIDETLAAGARDTLGCSADPGGGALYAAFVLQHATSAMSPDTLHELGAADVARLTAEQDAVARAAGYADRAAYAAALANDARELASSAEALRDELRALCKRIDGLIPRWFATIPRSTYGVETIPASEAARMPFAYAQPGPADRRAAGTFFVTPDPARCPRRLHPAVALHEAWPGHLMQTALIHERDDLPMFRRHGAGNYTALVEGWGLYCERLGEEMGVYDTPSQRFGRLELEMLRALRLMVDTGIHARGWTRERAVATMAAHLTMPQPALEAEVDRYAAIPAQALGYQLGNHALREARRDAERAGGDAFDVRAFHDAVLGLGGASLPVLAAFVAQTFGAPREHARAG